MARRRPQYSVRPQHQLIKDLDDKTYSDGTMERVSGQRKSDRRIDGRAAQD